MTPAQSIAGQSGRQRAGQRNERANSLEDNHLGSISGVTLCGDPPRRLGTALFVGCSGVGNNATPPSRVSTHRPHRRDGVMTDQGAGSGGGRLDTRPSPPLTTGRSRPLPPPEVTVAVSSAGCPSGRYAACGLEFRPVAPSLDASAETGLRLARGRLRQGPRAGIPSGGAVRTDVRPERRHRSPTAGLVTVRPSRRLGLISLQVRADPGTPECAGRWCPHRSGRHARPSGHRCGFRRSAA